ncbi:transcription elongation factor GreB [Salmonella enterica subsp. enterica serovar Choleraesuis]|nr:transcription elongation factor GreB [Salmonella enterica subsp. enterica serovar Choleraesuis]
MATKLITRAGYNKLKQEHDYLWNEKRPEITKIVSWAASLGDRSENADYTFNKRILREIDRRVRYLRKLLPALQIVDYSPQQDGRVFFGAWVEIENDEGTVKRFRIVGPEEIYGDRKDYISIDSPMARALLKKQVDEEFVVCTPDGEKQWFINNIEYEQESEDSGDDQ